MPGKTSRSRESVSVVACINASGGHMPPMIIVKGATYRTRLSWETRDAPNGTDWGHQKKAWMTEDLGVAWSNRAFLKYCGDERPQLLVLDGHRSHTSLSLLTTAQEHNINIITLPAHT